MHTGKKIIILLLVLKGLNAFCQKDLSTANIHKNETAAIDRLYPDSISSREFGSIISLDGEWDIAEGSLGDLPKKYPYTISVPGVVNNKETPFIDIGMASHRRKAFWYRKTFTVNGIIPEVARLKIFKAMFGTKVFLNGREIGSNALNFTPGYFDVKPYLKGNGQTNEIVVRIGAFIDQAADTVLSGGEPERRRYPPGIYDRVEIILSGSPYILRTQVVPDIEGQRARIVIDATAGPGMRQSLALRLNVFEYGNGKKVASADISIKDITAGKTQTAAVFISMPGCKLWSPEEANLYVLQITDGQYNYFTRFGMRSFSIDTAFVNRALLNGAPYYIRGTNFAIHRFFEDSLCRRQPWDKAWVRKLIRAFKAMGMNSARFCISAAPEIWFDIADEEGMIVFDEFPLWSAFQPAVGDVSKEAKHPYKKWGIVKNSVKAYHIANEYTRWMQERWNHASVCVWDAQNETWWPETGKAIQMVRGLDLSNRPWDNGWSPPMAPGDIREAHPYFESYTKGTEQLNDRKKITLPFTLADIPKQAKIASTFYMPYQRAYKQPLQGYWQQAVVINEYSYLWLNRNGSPTSLTKDFYDAVLGTEATADQRRELYAKYLAAVTGYWRALRTSIGILYPFGLNYSIAGGETSDNLVDVDSVSFDKYFLKYVPDAFAPLAISIDFWEEKIELSNNKSIPVDVPLVITNDINASQTGYLRLQLLQGDKLVSEMQSHFEVAALQQSRVILRMDLPPVAGKYQLVADIGSDKNAPIKSYRDIEIVKQ